MSKSSGVRGNEGVIGETINAQVIVVGRDNTVNLSSANVEQVRSSINELKRAIVDLAVPEDAKASISAQVHELQVESEKPAPDHKRIEGILSTLSLSAKVLADFVSNVTTIVGPIVKIAALFGVVLP